MEGIKEILREKQRLVDEIKDLSSNCHDYNKEKLIKGSKDLDKVIDKLTSIKME